MRNFTGDAPTAAQPSVMADRREIGLVAVERTRMPMVVSDARQPDISDCAGQQSIPEFDRLFVGRGVGPKLQNSCKVQVLHLKQLRRSVAGSPRANIS